MRHVNKLRSTLQFTEERLDSVSGNLDLKPDSNKNRKSFDGKLMKNPNLAVNSETSWKVIVRQV